MQDRHPAERCAFRKLVRRDRTSQLADIIRCRQATGGQRPTVEIEAEFGFSSTFHASRRYPGLEEHQPSEPPRLQSHLVLRPGRADFGGWSAISAATANTFDHLVGGALPISWRPLDETRSQRLPLWFVAGCNQPTPAAGRRPHCPAVIGVERLGSLWASVPCWHRPSVQAALYGDRSWALGIRRCCGMLSSRDRPCRVCASWICWGRGGEAVPPTSTEPQRIDFEIGGKLVRLAQLSQVSGDAGLGGRCHRSGVPRGERSPQVWRPAADRRVGSHPAPALESNW